LLQSENTSATTVTLEVGVREGGRRWVFVRAVTVCGIKDNNDEKLRNTS
jgi:hypothetical protein